MNHDPWVRFEDLIREQLRMKRDTHFVQYGMAMVAAVKRA